MIEYNAKMVDVSDFHISDVFSALRKTTVTPRFKKKSF